MSEHNTNTGKPFEQLTRQMFELILAQDPKLTGATTINVQHDVDVVGRTGTYQVDVYWEFELGGIRHKVLVSCKDWKTKVKREQVMSFKETLDDVPGQPRGLVVARTGFQEGAREFADAHGIELYELRAPDERNLGDRIMSVRINGRFAVPHFGEVKLIPDDEWNRSEGRRLGIPAGTQYTWQMSPSDSLLDVDDRPARTLESVLREAQPRSFDAMPRASHELRFAEPLYVHTSDTRFRARMVGIAFEFSQTVIERVIEVTAPEVIVAVLQRVADGRRHVLRTDGTLTELKE